MRGACGIPRRRSRRLPRRSEKPMRQGLEAQPQEEEEARGPDPHLHHRRRHPLAPLRLAEGGPPPAGI